MFFYHHLRSIRGDCGRVLMSLSTLLCYFFVTAAQVLWSGNSWTLTNSKLIRDVCAHMTDVTYITRGPGQVLLGPLEPYRTVVSKCSDAYFVQPYVI